MNGQETTTNPGVDDQTPIIVTPELVNEPGGMTPREEKYARLLEQYEESQGLVVDPDQPPSQVDIPKLRPTKADSPLIVGDDGTQSIRLKVNGQEVVKPLEQALVDFQKYESADARLRQAAEQQKQLQDYERRLAAEAAILQSKSEMLAAQAHQAQQAAAQRPAPVDDAAAKELIEAIYNADPDAHLKLVNVLSKNQPTPAPVQQINTDHIANLAANQAAQAVQQQLAQQRFLDSIEAGKSWLAAEHPEVVNDPDLYQFVNLKTDEISRINPTMSAEDVIKTSTLQVLQKFNMASTPQTRADAKRELPTPIQRQHNSTPTANKPDENYEESPQQVAEKIRQARSAYRGYQN